MKETKPDAIDARGSPLHNLKRLVYNIAGCNQLMF